MVAALSACGVSDPSRTSPAGTPAPLFNFSTLSHPALAPAIGAWQTACSTQGADHDGGATIERLEVADANTTYTIHEFDDAGCVDADLDIISTFSVTDASQYTLRADGSDIILAHARVHHHDPAPGLRGHAQPDPSLR